MRTPTLLWSQSSRISPALDEIHLYLAGLQYCDLAGLRAMTRLAGVSGSRNSRRVVLHGVPQKLRTVLSILGWDSTPGLVIDHEESDHQ